MGIVLGSARCAGAIALVFAVVATSLPAEAQQRGQYTGHCRRITSQIERYQGDIQLAQSRGNDSWESATKLHVRKLRERRSELCPEYDEWVIAAAARRRAEEMAALMRLAGRAALAYFTGGLSGF